MGRGHRSTAPDKISAYGACCRSTRLDNRWWIDRDVFTTIPSLVQISHYDVLRYILAHKAARGDSALFLLM